MKTPSINLDGQEVVVVDKSMFQDLVYKMASNMRESKRKKISNLKEALEILGCSKTTLYKMLKDPKCKIRKSSVNGKFITESLDRELERLDRIR
ncbi:hypothetical protein [Aquimarina sp. 2201CG5-10]|uniref:hypothetical protein n=1 Tax=Aquimarina callyspongiae TaxID=3098150 RepID=UPI002AB4EE3F|nr:hypothetical protein [Aquimarina sp. 2201CG5-10]MDY8137606.1 hypothetical protein [Aquimarina sp. 2201CG5-10]